MDIQILIVEDDAALKDSLQRLFEISGYNPFSAVSAEEAMEILKTNAIQVVITDIMLPGTDGLELTELIKKDFDVDVIVMTGYSGNYSYEEVINKGASDLVFKPIRSKELLLRLKRVLRERDLRQERINILKELQKLAITDNLTSLYNSRYFYNQLAIEVDRSNRYSHPLSLLLLDIDHFKEYNDTYGHLEGDKVLSRLAEIIMSCLRMMDSAYRYGGEEFTIILPETSGEEAKIVAQRIRMAVESEKFSPQPGKKVNTTISIGVTEYSQKEELRTFVQRADKAMYTAKEKGRNRIFFLPA